MRGLWVSDSPASPSGFGAVTRAVCRRLAERGHRVEIVGWQTRGGPTRWEGIPVHPVRHDTFGADVLLGYMMRLQPHFVVTLGDVWWMSFMTDPGMQRYLDLSGGRWVLYYPIDGSDLGGRLPPGWVKTLEAADVPVAMSRFGADVSSACGIEASYIPHGVDLDVFVPPGDKELAKARFGYEGRFVVLSDARNQPRKLLPRTLDVAAAFARGKEDVVLHLHADPFDDAAESELYSYRLIDDVKTAGLEETVRLTANFRMLSSGGLAPEDLAALYAASDAHLLCSWGEGFGLPNLQAASAGVVPIAVAYAASRELCAGHGYAVPSESTVVDEFGLVRHLIDRSAAAAALEELYASPALLAERSRASREFALSYSWDAIADDWERVLEEAPPRRRPTRTRSYDWIVGDYGRGESEMPDAVAAAASDVFATLPDGARVNVKIAERTAGEVAATIRQDAFLEGDYLSVPVRLAPFFEGAPRPRVGNLLVGPPDLYVAAQIKHVFPCVTVSVPRSDGNPENDTPLSLEELLPPLAHYALVVDLSADGAQDIDLACASLGIPYLGPSRLWPAVEGSELEQVRLLLTDQGISERRREIAAERALTAYGPEIVETLRAYCLAGQPEPARQPAAQQQRPPGWGEVEMLLVRAREGAEPDANEQIAEWVAQQGGLVLMATGGDSLIVALPAHAKEALQSHRLVELAGGIELDEEGKGARALKGLFAVNAAKQLAAAGERG